MRKHLINCFEREELSPFPVVEQQAKTNLKRVICRKKHLFVHTYCVCSLPESYDSEMVQCELCEHFKCMNIVSVPEYWTCTNCN